MADVRDFVSHDEMVLSVDGGLDVVAHYAGATTTGSHGSCIWISQGDLLIRELFEFGFDAIEPGHLLFQHGDLFLQTLDFGCSKISLILAVSGFQGRQIAFDSSYRGC